jgi:hypothetical protein
MAANLISASKWPGGLRLSAAYAKANELGRYGTISLPKLLPKYVVTKIVAHNSLKLWCRPPESNRRPTDYESVALPTELGRLGIFRAEAAYGTGVSKNPASPGLPMQDFAAPLNCLNGLRKPAV